MKRLVLLILLMIAPLCFGATNSVVDVIKNSDNTLPSGVIQVSSPPFRSPDGTNVAGGTRSFILTNGVVNVTVYSNTGGPAYSVRFALSDGKSWTECWLVPVSTESLTLTQVRITTCQMSAPVGMISESQVTNLIADLNTLRADIGVQGSNAAIWGTVTGTLAAQTDLQAALNGKAATTDVRFTDARTPLTHATSHAAGSTDPVSIAASQVASGVFNVSRVLSTPTASRCLRVNDSGTAIVVATQDCGSGTTAWGSIGGTLATQTDLQAALDAKAAFSHVHVISDVTNLQTALDSKVASSDARLTDARTPLAHATSHASAGTDPLTLAESQVTNLTTDLSGKVASTRTVNGHALSSDVTVTKGDVGLGSVDNTSDVSKPVSTLQQTALDAKVGTSDARLTDARTPLAHAASHALGSSDAVTLSESQITNLATDLATKVTANLAVVGATKTKVTYDSKGLVTAGADATTADIADSLNKRYTTDAQLTALGSISGVNTGDQDLSGLVPKTTTVASHPLSANVAIAYGDLTDAPALLFSASTMYNGLPGASTYLLDWIVPTYSPAVTITIPANCSGSTFKARTVATGSSVFTVAKNGSTICTATVAPGGSTATWSTGGSSASLTSNDELTIIGGGDATLSGITMSIAGTR